MADSCGFVHIERGAIYRNMIVRAIGGGALLDILSEDFKEDKEIHAFQAMDRGDAITKRCISRSDTRQRVQSRSLVRLTGEIQGADAGRYSGYERVRRQEPGRLIIMSRFYRLSMTEVNLLEVIVELRDTFVEMYPVEFINNILSQAATDAIRQRWKMINPNTDYPPNIPEHFQIEPLSDFDRNTVGPGFRPFHYQTPIGAVSYIVRAPSGLVILSCHQVEKGRVNPTSIFGATLRWKVWGVSRGYAGISFA